MDRTERFYKIDPLLRANKCVPQKRFLQELEVSRATFKRDIECMRSGFHAHAIPQRRRQGEPPEGGAVPDAARSACPMSYENAFSTSVTHSSKLRR